MNFKHGNIKNLALISGTFLFVFLLSMKPLRTGSSAPVYNFKDSFNYTINKDSLNSNTDTIVLANTEKKDFKQIANQTSKISDTVFMPQTNYLLDSNETIKDYLNYSVKNNGKKLTFLRNDSIIFVRENGTLPWRNNNPGALKYGNFAKKYGAIGKGNRNFAVFPTKEMGLRALKALLQTDFYKKLTVGGAIEVFAPRHENNTDRYKRRIKGLTGVSLSKRLRDLSDSEFERVISAIITLEGSVVGKETLFTDGKPVVKKDTNVNLIVDTLIRQNIVKTL